MNEFSFEWSGAKSLKEELASSFVRASLLEISHNMAFGINLWRADGTALGICSKMHDVAYRQEVGVLSFQALSLPSSDKIVVELPDYFLSVLNVKKLTILHENGILAESGVILEMNGGHELMVVAGSFPCSIAVCGLPGIQNLCTPEWPIEKYDRQDFKV